MWRVIIATCIVVTLWLAAACGGPALTTEQAATATAVSALATWGAQPADVKRATVDAVMATITAGSHK